MLLTQPPSISWLSELCFRGVSSIGFSLGFTSGASGVFSGYLPFLLRFGLLPSTPAESQSSGDFSLWSFPLPLSCCLHPMSFSQVKWAVLLGQVGCTPGASWKRVSWEISCVWKCLGWYKVLSPPEFRRRHSVVFHLLVMVVWSHFDSQSCTCDLFLLWELWGLLLFSLFWHLRAVCLDMGLFPATVQGSNVLQYGRLSWSCLFVNNFFLSIFLVRYSGVLLFGYWTSLFAPPRC